MNKTHPSINLSFPRKSFTFYNSKLNSTNPKTNEKKMNKFQFVTEIISATWHAQYNFKFTKIIFCAHLLPATICFTDLWIRHFVYNFFMHFFTNDFPMSHACICLISWMENIHNVCGFILMRFLSIFTFLAKVCCLLIA